MWSWAICCCSVEWWVAWCWGPMTLPFSTPPLCCECHRPTLCVRYAIVTRVDELRGKAAGSAQQKFRMALSGLQGDPEQLANLFRLVQKALFEQEPLLQAASPSAGHASSAAPGDKRS